MPEYQRSATIDAAPEELFEYLADIHHLPEYFPAMISAEPVGGDTVETQVQGHREHDRGWFHIDESHHRIEWGSADNPDYRGWITIDPDAMGSTLTIHLNHQATTDADSEIDATIDTIKRRMRDTHS